jgi:hypothetical protein
MAVIPLLGSVSRICRQWLPRVWVKDPDSGRGGGGGSPVPHRYRPGAGLALDIRMAGPRAKDGGDPAAGQRFTDLQTVAAEGLGKVQLQHHYLGVSGAGKTSLINAISGLTRPQAGRIVLNGRVLNDTAYRTG